MPLIPRFMTVALFVSCFASQGIAQPTDNDLSPELRAALAQYLGRDCSVEEQPKALQRVLKLSDKQRNVVIPVLAQTFQNGPDSPRVERVRQSLRDEWQRRKQALERARPKYLSPEHVRTLTDPAKLDDYVNQGLNSYRFQVRERSLIALHRIDSKAARITIENARKSDGQQIEAVILAAERAARLSEAMAAPPSHPKPGGKKPSSKKIE